MAAKRKTNQSKPANRKGDQSAPVFKAPNFDDVITSLRNHGIKAIRKRKFRLLGKDRIPDTVPGKSFNLKEPPLKRPLFWVPIGFDGYGWKVYLCVPPWMENESIASKWYLTWCDFFKLGRTDDLLEDPEYFVHCRLDDLKAARIGSTSKLTLAESDDVASYRAAVSESYDLLRRAMVEAAPMDSPTESCETQRPEDDRNLRLPEEIARVMELSFRAGQLCERAGWYGRKIPTIARKAMPLVEAQRTESGPRLAWTKAAAEVLFQNPGVKVRKLLEMLAEKGLVFTLDEWETVDFEDRTPSKSISAFSRAISRIRRQMKKI